MPHNFYQAKNKLNKVSKLIIEKINNKLISELHFNQWKITDSVSKCFTNIYNEKDCSFVQLNSKEYYSSINENILINDIQFAKLHTTTDNKNLGLIIHCRNFYCFAIMKLGERNQQKAALMLPWAVLMVPKK